MKFKSLNEKAKHLDGLIDEYRRAEHAVFVPMSRLNVLVLSVFPEAKKASYGLHKMVFRIRHKSHQLALKVGKAQAVEHDHKAYKMLPHAVRHVYFAKVFWHTKYCLLQEWGEEADVSPHQLSKVRTEMGKYGLLDITCDNIRHVNGALKIIDAGVAPPGLFRLWKTADTITRALPPPVSKIVRKSRLITTVKQ